MTHNLYGSPQRVSLETPMKEVVIQRLTSRLAAYSVLLAVMEQVDIERKLDITKNKNLAEHLWCVIGARESYC